MSLGAIAAVPANTGARGGPTAEPGYRQAIDVSTTHAAPAGCTYRSRIHGSLVSLDASAAIGGVGGLYVPDRLTLDAALDCGAVMPPQRVSQPVTLAAPVPREQLAAAIERVARFEVPQGTRICTVAPRIAVTNGVPVATDVVSRCEPRAPNATGH
jgi:hypothetical protein